MNVLNTEVNDTQVPDATGTPEAAVENTNLEGAEGEGKVEAEVVPKEEIEQEKQKRQSRLDRRFKELTSKVNGLKSDGQSLRETLLEITGQAPPTRADFTTPEEYNDAMADYRESIRVPKAQLTAVEKAHGKAEEELQTTLLAQWDDKVEAEKARFPDFHKIVKAADIPLSPTVSTAILKHKAGVSIVYYLATHPETARDLIELPIDEQILELGQIASKVQAKRSVVLAGKDETDPPAPPPTPRVPGGGAPRKKDPGSMSLDEYNAWRKAGGGT